MNLNSFCIDFWKINIAASFLSLSCDIDRYIARKVMYLAAADVGEFLTVSLKILKETIRAFIIFSDMYEFKVLPINVEYWFLL